MKLIPLPAFDDNYIWMLHDGHQALVVDPGDAQPVLDALKRLNVQLQAILVTHHHGDHTGGVDTLRQATGARVYGPARETIPEPLTRLQAGDRVSSLGLDFEVLEVPGHTAGHLSVLVRGEDSAYLLAGDLVHTSAELEAVAPDIAAYCAANNVVVLATHDQAALDLVSGSSAARF